MSPWKILVQKKHRKNCKCSPTLHSRVPMLFIVDIVVFNCQKCIQYHKCQVSGHKYLGLLFEGVLKNVIVIEI